MYIIKNALRCIGRSKGRNILIGIIALVIAVSACIGLSIRQAAESAKASALDGMCVTATISYDRAGAMNQMGGGRGQGGKGQGGGFDRNEFADMMGNASSLTLEEYQKYALDPFKSLRKTEKITVAGQLSQVKSVGGKNEALP